MKKFIFSPMVLVLAFMATYSPALAQRETATGVEVETDVILLRRDLRADKKQLIALNLSLTEAEATKFWPVYDQYAAEMRVDDLARVPLSFPTYAGALGRVAAKITRELNKEAQIDLGELL